MPFMAMVPTSCMGMVHIRFLPVWQWFLKVPTSMVMVPTSMVLIRFLQCTCMAMEWCWDSDWSFSIPWLQSGLGALANILIYTQEYSVLLAHTTTLPERREGGGEEGGGEGARERERKGEVIYYYPQLWPTY